MRRTNTRSLPHRAYRAAARLDEISPSWFTGQALTREAFGVIWRKWLARRSDLKGMPWERMRKLLAFFSIPEARVVHSIYAAKPRSQESRALARPQLCR